MKKIVIETEVKGSESVEKTINNFTRMKKELKEAKNELAGFDVGTAGFDKAQQKVAKLADALGDLQDATKIQGTGVEKLSASFGLLQESLATANIDKAKLALQGLGSAMKAIPIFLLIEGFKLLWENKDKVIEFFDASTSAAERNKQAIEDLSSATDTYNKDLDNQIEYLKSLSDVEGLSYKSKVQIIENIAKLEDAKLANKEKLAEKEMDLERRKLAELQGAYKTKQLGAFNDEKFAEKLLLAATQTVGTELNKQYLLYLDANVKLDKVRLDQQANIGKYNAAIKALDADVEKNKLEDYNKAVERANKEQDIFNLRTRRARELAAAEEAASKYLADEQIRIAKEKQDRLAQIEPGPDEAYLRTLEQGKAQFEVEQRIGKDEYQLKVDALNKQKQIEIEKVGYTEEGAKARYQIEKEYADKISKLTEDHAKTDYEKKTAYAQKTASTISSYLGQISSLIGQYNALVQQEAQDKIAKLDADYNLRLQNTQLASDQLLQNLNDQITAEDEALEAQRQRELKAAGDNSAKKEKINEKYNKQRAIQDRKAAQAATIEKNRVALEEYAMALSKYNAETEIRRKAFEEDKKLRVAQTVITTIQGAITAFAGAMSLGPVAGPIVGAALAAAVTAMGAISVSRIKAQQFQAGTPPSAPVLAAVPKDIGAGSGPSSEVKRQTLFSSGGKSQSEIIIPDAAGERQRPQRAYVLVQDVNSAQQLDASIDAKSSF